ncbi:MAG: hypothetical protein ACLP0A_15710, partial [Verrucomicrobiia bacterium]
MKTQFDMLESQLNSLRPSPLPTSTRRRILHEMERTVSRPKSIFWSFGQHAGLPIALAGALSDELEKQIDALETKLGDICYLDPTLRQKDEEALHEILRHRHGLFLGKAPCNGRIGILSNSAMHTRLKNFARHLNLHVQAPDLAQ